MFLHVSVNLFKGGWWYPSMHCRCIPACLAVGLWGGGWYPSMPCRFPGPHPRGSSMVWPGAVSRSTPRGVPRPTQGVSRPTPGGTCSRGRCLLQGVACSRGHLHRGGVEIPREGYCCGRYASYWNAFLFYRYLCQGI